MSGNMQFNLHEDETRKKKKRKPKKSRFAGMEMMERWFKEIMRFMSKHHLHLIQRDYQMSIFSHLPPGGGAVSHSKEVRKIDLVIMPQMEMKREQGIFIRMRKWVSQQYSPFCAIRKKGKYLRSGRSRT